MDIDGTPCNLAITPDCTALRQRAERAERIAAQWHRVAIVLAGACALLLAIG